MTVILSGKVTFHTELALKYLTPLARLPLLSCGASKSILQSHCQPHCAGKGYSFTKTSKPQMIFDITNCAATYQNSIYRQSNVIKRSFFIHSSERVIVSDVSEDNHTSQENKVSSVRDVQSGETESNPDTDVTTDLSSERNKIVELHELTCKEGKEWYIEPKTGFLVFSELYHKKRGYCCGNACRHCPYGHENVPAHQRNKKFNSFFYE